MVEEVVRQYRQRDLPLDVIYLDIHYMNGYRVFTFDPNRFPDPKGLTEKLSQQGVKTVVIVDPGVKYQPPMPGATDWTDTAVHGTWHATLVHDDTTPGTPGDTVSFDAAF